MIYIWISYLLNAGENFLFFWSVRRLGTPSEIAKQRSVIKSHELENKFSSNCVLKFTCWEFRTLFLLYSKIITRVPKHQFYCHFYSSSFSLRILVPLALYKLRRNLNELINNLIDRGKSNYVAASTERNRTI